MKNNTGRRFFMQVVVNILYSTIIACLIEVFLITNIDMLVTYLVETESALASVVGIFRMGTFTTILYVLLGICIFSFTFLLLQRKSLKYIEKIASAVQNIADGDLTTQIEVVGDDEFSLMASSLNRMGEEIRELMEKERESERTKNELITDSEYRAIMALPAEERGTMIV